ncbi:MAG: hypothetical protein FD155_1765 [Bacteroidetes bacterium]|nr:MAG: hypothetical protein FD155_1765 [Bacteroidota bacterium]
MHQLLAKWKFKDQVGWPIDSGDFKKWLSNKKRSFDQQNNKTFKVLVRPI